MHLIFCLATIVSSLYAQRVEVRPATTVYMPDQADSNSPAFWRDGQFNIFNSTGSVLRTSGRDQFLYDYDSMQRVEWANIGRQPFWIEAAYQDDDGTIYAWYHTEPGGLCPGNDLSVPQIGAMVSSDGGYTFDDLGIVLESGAGINCSARNGFFAGGHGDFSVILDEKREYFYFLFSNYAGAPSAQGVAMARMAFEDRFAPVGTVYKYLDGAWLEPGIGGNVTAVFPSNVTWENANADSFWGPSIHWNTHLQRYVVIMNRACCEPRWPQEGIYITYTRDLSDPDAWAKPSLLLKDIGYGPGYYPQILGMGPFETDTVSGRTARLYVQGISDWELVFTP